MFFNKKFLWLGITLKISRTRMRCHNGKSIDVDLTNILRKTYNIIPSDYVTAGIENQDKDHKLKKTELRFYENKFIK